MEGWIKVYRDIQEHWIWQDSQKLKWWLDIIMMANIKDNKMLKGNGLVTIKRGTFHTSEVSLSTRWNVSRKTVTAFLGLLVEDGMITLQKDRNGTTIEVLNYKAYQDKNGQVGTANVTADVAEEVAADVAQVKKEKNVKKERINIDGEIPIDTPKKITRFIPPTLEEVQAYCLERKNSVDAERFIDFYATKGWMVGKNKMKDWKAAIRTWEKSSGSSYSKSPIPTKVQQMNQGMYSHEWDFDELEKMQREHITKLVNEKGGADA